MDIRTRRLQLGLTLQEVAEAVGVSDGTVSRWETGAISNMRRDKIYKLSKVLDMSPFDVMQYDADDRDDIPSTALATRIRTRRKEIGITQVQLAERMGYKTPIPIINMEKGASKFPKAKIIELAKALETSPAYLLGWEEAAMPGGTRVIPVLGSISAGMPIDRIEDVTGMSETIPGDWVGEFFALKIKGDSMAPRISDGDVVIVQCQNDAEDGDIVIAAINGDEATCKRLRKLDGSIMLQPNNPAYTPIIWDGKNGPAITIIGKVVELRCRF